jgi:hypothetical protein
LGCNGSIKRISKHELVYQHVFVQLVCFPEGFEQLECNDNQSLCEWDTKVKIMEDMISALKAIIFFMARDVEETIRGRKWDCTTLRLSHM